MSGFDIQFREVPRESRVFTDKIVLAEAEDGLVAAIHYDIAGGGALQVTAGDCIFMTSYQEIIEAALATARRDKETPGD